MKLDINTLSVQVVFQGARALASIGAIAGITILFIQEGTGGVLTQSWDSLAQASSIFSSFVS